MHMSKQYVSICCIALAAVMQFNTPLFGQELDAYVAAEEDSLVISPELLAEYEKYEEQAQRERRDYLNAIRSIWSADSILLDSPTVWVEYSKDFMSRTVVDFETGKVRVEVATPHDAGNAKGEVTQRLTTTLSQLLNSRGSACNYPSVVEDNATLTDRPVLDGMLDLSRLAISNPAAKPKGKRHFGVSSRASEADYLKTNEGLTAEQNDQIALSVVEKLMAAGLTDEYASPHMLFSRDGSDPEPDGTTIDITSLLLELTDSHLDKNAVVYQDIVNQYSEQFDIEKALVYAVMEQESRFNPKATSHVPAYGLMQLVPKSGGLASYRYVYKEDHIPTSSFLYVPQQNVQLGTALLRILMNQFSKIEDAACRRLCVIASYNTGAGNVSRSFIGRTKIADALPLINEMNYSELYTHLTTKLGSSEARNYVKYVEERREKYLTQLQ